MKISKRFINKRSNSNNESAEDYTELIYDLINSKGEARISDLAESFGVSHVTVIRTLKRLSSKNLVIKENRKPISLTNQGIKLAIKSKERHNIIVKFLISLGVSQQVAQLDAEGIEHHVSEETLKKIIVNIKKMEK